MCKMSDAIKQVKHLNEFLSNKLNTKVTKHEAKSLEEVGEDFGSELLAVEATVEEDGKENVLHAIVKAISATSFESEDNQVAFKNEVGFYAEIVPAIKEFQQEYGVVVDDNFPKFYGARNNLKPSGDFIDGDAIIVLENLKVAAYENIAKQEAFDLHSTKAILAALASFQATVLALRTQKPQVFQSQISPYFRDWTKPNAPLDLEVILNENPDTAHLIRKTKRALTKNRFKKIREPWATLTHGQLWASNIMVRPTDDGINGVKFLDFQLQDYGSPAIDVLFFLLTSVQVSVLRYHFQKLLQHYFKEFTNGLLQYKIIDISDFTFEGFQEELKIESSYQIYRSLHTLSTTFGAIDKESNGHAQNGANSKISPRISQVKFPLKIKERVWYIVEEAAKQNWI